MPLKCNAGVIDIFFDNIGKYIVKNYRVSFQKTTAVDVVTTALQIIHNCSSNIQCRKDLMPQRCDNTSLVRIHKEMEAHINNANSNFRKFRFRFISNIFNMAKIKDNDVNNIVEQLDKKRKCSNAKCGRTFENLKRKCDVVLLLRKPVVWR